MFDVAVDYGKVLAPTVSGMAQCLQRRIRSSFTSAQDLLTDFWFSPIPLNSAINVQISIIREMRVDWLRAVLNLSEKDTRWLGLNDTFKF